MRKITFQERNFWVWVAVATLIMEIITVLCRIMIGHSAEEFNATQNPPFLLKIHHLFWAIPFIVCGLAVRGKIASYVLWSLALGLIFSDLMHHFIVLPIWVGNTGWHWP